MNDTLYYSKAIMGGGKSYSAIDYICCDIKEKLVYAVPTIELVRQIHKDIEETENPFEFDVVTVDGREYEGHVPLDRQIKAITSSEYQDVKKEFIEHLKSDGKDDVLVITHECLFSLKGSDFKLLKEWVVFIDEDPYPLRINTVTDSGHQITALNSLIKTIPNNLNQITELELSDVEIEDLRSLATKEHGRAYADNVRDFLSIISSERKSEAYFKNCDGKSVWMVVSYMPLKQIIQSAIETYVFSSNLSSLTKLYLDINQIELGTPRFRAKHLKYPKPLQKKIKIYRVWKTGNHSIKLLKDYDSDKLKKALLEVVDGKGFISRTNDSFSNYFDGIDNHIERVSKITNGLNKFIDVSCLIDLAVYNTSADFNEFFFMLDEKYGVEEGAIKKGRDEKETLETSAQAVGRLGLRMIDVSKEQDYIVVVPDLRTEEYLKANYFPDANYMDSIINEQVHGTAGRKKGTFNKETPVKVKEVDRLVKEERWKKKDAIKEVGIGSRAYYSYKKQQC